MPNPASSLNPKGTILNTFKNKLDINVNKCALKFSSEG
jgi:hypothetical protein